MNIKTSAIYDSLWIMRGRPYDFTTKKSQLRSWTVGYSEVLIFIPYFIKVRLLKKWLLIIIARHVLFSSSSNFRKSDIFVSKFDFTLSLSKVNLKSPKGCEHTPEIRPKSRYYTRKTKLNRVFIGKYKGQN